MALSKGIRAINLGCGTVTAPDWINLDNSPGARLAKFPRLRWFLWKVGFLSNTHYQARWPQSLIIRDLRKPLPFSDASVDYVYTSHYLEHNSLADARKLLQEIYRVLRPGGIVRIVVPDLALGAHRYLEAIRANPEDASAAPEFLNWLQLTRSNVRDPHLWMYDAPSLTAMLRGCGFNKIVVCEYREGCVPDCKILDNRPEESLYIEAERSAQMS
jgi:SAM-dependent methyltransferase